MTRIEEPVKRHSFSLSLLPDYCPANPVAGFQEGRRTILLLPGET